MDDRRYSHVVGVFKEQVNAEEAIEALKRAGFSENQMQLTVYRPNVDGEVQTAHQRFVLHVDAEGREQEAVGIMASCGANNADLPAGTTLEHGSIVDSGADGTEHVPEELMYGNSDQFFGDTQTPGH
jgi:hypothetical protein